ncbi:hypothetical protein RRG08_057686 [Elysia crispata]|uniref:Uncharacterized protein n=1 Tax=Elysia crispata TaxID=231223 RepID=A0AAE1AED4_9GAST|nr:hypothetical protein RRG08_057686 [Elysia crispata]
MVSALEGLSHPTQLAEKASSPHHCQDTEWTRQVVTPEPRDTEDLQDAAWFSPLQNSHVPPGQLGRAPCPLFVDSEQAAARCLPWSTRMWHVIYVHQWHITFVLGPAV